jgi:proteasome accessory factor A
VAKLCGADMEVGNFILGMESASGTGREASQALLNEIDGVTSRSSYGSTYYAHGYYWDSHGSSRDWGRKYLWTNGGCVYIDLDHLELCIPEVRGAHDFVAAVHAMFRVAREAQLHANEKLPEGHSIQVLLNNSDGRSNSYGSHINFLVSRAAWEDIFERKLHYLGFLASYQLSSMIFAGQGKVGSENGRPEVCFQLSSRADFFETLVGTQTTYRRPIVNSRDEALCGSVARDGAARDLARLHCIFYDNNLCHVANLLKIGVMQIVLAMIEAERVNAELMLEDPVEAAVLWSHDGDLRQRCRLVSGKQVSAVELQLMILEAARSCEAAGDLYTVPRFVEILELWEDTLLKLEERDYHALTRRLDWALKLQILNRALVTHPRLSWDSVEIKYLDFIYGSLELSEGLYWAQEAAGTVDRVVDEDRIEQLTHEPPVDTRAWTRAMLLRAIGASQITDVDWDSLRFGGLALPLDDPRRFGRRETLELFRALERADDIALALGARSPYASYPTRIN